jgi:hypothetical protein
MLVFPEWSLPLCFVNKIWGAFLIYPVHAICSTHLILDLITLVIFCGKYKLCSSSLCNFLQLLLSLRSLVPCSQTHSIYILLLGWGIKIHTHTKQLGNIIVYFNHKLFRYIRQNILKWTQLIFSSSVWINSESCNILTMTEVLQQTISVTGKVTIGNKLLHKFKV